MDKYEAALELIDASNKILYSRKVLGDPFYLIKNQLLASIIHSKQGNQEMSEKALQELPTLVMVDDQDDYLDRFRKNIEADYPLINPK